MRHINDYLHFYIGSQAKLIWMDDPATVRGMTWDEAKIARHGDVKLVLRPLSDMTQSEQEDYSQLSRCYLTPTAEATMRKHGALTKYLISRGFDVFDLIVLGLAIDATKVPQP